MKKVSTDLMFDFTTGANFLMMIVAIVFYALNVFQFATNMILPITFIQLLILVGNKKKFIHSNDTEIGLNIFAALSLFSFS